MQNLLQIIVVLLSATCFLGAIVALLIQRPYLFIAMFFLLFNFCLRIVSLAYIDLAGPVDSVQLFRTIGPGMATPIYSAAYLIVLIPVIFLFSPSILKAVTAGARIDDPLPQTRVSFADAVFYLSILFIIILYADMIRIGVIPLFSRLERYDYLKDHAGTFHKILVDHGFLPVFVWGCIFSYTWIHRKVPEIRFAVLLVILLIYLFLTGNRFSAFYVYSSFFAIPVAAVLIANLSRPRTSERSRTNRGLIWIFVGLGVVFLLIVAALGNSYFVVRTLQPESGATQLLQRILVQPSELAWLTYERVFMQGQINQEGTIQWLFFYPFDPARNTSIQYLMVLALGNETAEKIISVGSQYAGGFPEILFEMFGVLAWPMLFIAGLITGALLLLLLRAVIYGHFLTAVFALYVLFGFFVMYIGGMLNFVMPWTYWAKIAALMASIALEHAWMKAGFRLIPWRLIASR